MWTVLNGCLLILKYEHIFIIFLQVDLYSKNQHENQEHWELGTILQQMFPWNQF